MYGFFLHSLADWVMKTKGGDTWRKICLACGGDLAGGHVFIHRQYSEAVTNQLLEYSASIFEISLQDLLESLGHQFLDFCKQSGYHRFLVALGNTLHDLLSNLDVIYHHLETFYPAMCPPTFHCSPVSDGSLLLEYRTKRPQLVPFLCGLIKAMAMDFFQLEVSIEVESPRKEGDPSTLFISDKAAQALRRRKRASSLAADFSQFRASSNPKDLSISMATFGVLFPFHIIMNRNMEVVQAGSKIKPLIEDLIKSKPSGANTIRFNDIFVIQRPLIPAIFSGILSNSNSLFTLKLKQICCNSTTTHREAAEACSSGEAFFFRGQMIYIPESDYILFVGSARAQELTSLSEAHLCLTDIPSHDVTRDLFLVSQSRRQGRELVRKLEETSSNLLQMRETLEHEKRKTDTLLHSMLPQHIAQELRLNQRVQGQKFELVTILCSDIVQFTSLCGHEGIVPMDIIRVLNKLYTQFDALTSIHSVCKVETIGDAYHIVGGLPEFTADHADRVIAMAFDMIDVCVTVLSPANGKPIQVRLGVHSGECVAGVVGQKKPRYCLFGRTLTVASQMEACSLPGRINITEDTRRHLTTHATSKLILEENRHKDPALRCYLLSRPQHQSHPNVALGLPPMKGMFKTPNPTPPSSLEASPCDSPLFPVPRLASNDTWLSVQRPTPEDYGLIEDTGPPETLVFDFSQAVLSNHKNKQAEPVSHQRVKDIPVMDDFKHKVVWSGDDQMPEVQRPDRCEHPDQNHTNNRGQIKLLDLKDNQLGDMDQDSLEAKSKESTSEIRKQKINNNKHTSHNITQSPPTLNLCDNNLLSELGGDNNTRTDQGNNKKTRSKSTHLQALTPGMARRNGLNRRYSDLEPNGYTCDDTLVLYFRSCPTSPCDG